MATFSRGTLLSSLLVSVIALGACSTTGSDNNMNNSQGASRVDSILERAAQQARASGNKAETVDLLEQIYDRNPKDAAVATGFAQALRDDEQFNRARQIVAPFAQGEEAYPDAVTELAMIQLSLGQYKEAELTARKAVELAPESGRAYLALGTALDAQNYHEQAEVAFRRGIDKWKGDPAPIMNNLALNLASQNKLDQAIDMLEKAQKISPNRQELERNLRIIRTLKEGADDFYNKPKVVEKPAPKKADSEVKKEEPAESKPEVKKEEEKKPVKKVETKPEDDSSSTNRRGAKQNFNSN